MNKACSRLCHGVRFSCLLLIVILLPTVTLASPTSPDESSQFIRLHKTQAGEALAMQTSILHFVSAGKSGKKQTVDLVSAVHIGDKSYFQELNKRFQSYDAMLYEMVTDPTRKPPKDSSESGNPIATVQHMMGSMLELSFQLDEIDYDRPNFIRADLSSTQFIQAMKRRGETFSSMFIDMMMRSYAQQLKANKQGQEARILLSLLLPDRSRRLKLIIAQQFLDLEAQVTAIEGPEGSILISERNDKALEVLKAQLSSGKKSFAIYYGAGHMPGFSDKLQSEFGFELESIIWLDAWDLRKNQEP